MQRYRKFIGEAPTAATAALPKGITLDCRLLIWMLALQIRLQKGLQKRFGIHRKVNAVPVTQFFSVS